MKADNYKYRPGQSIEVEIKPGYWQPGAFMSYQANRLDGPHDCVVITESDILTVPVSKIRSVE